jgi:hypothetical protein
MNKIYLSPSMNLQTDRQTDHFHKMWQRSLRATESDGSMGRSRLWRVNGDSGFLTGTLGDFILTEV